jgi:hypothetical protein
MSKKPTLAEFAKDNVRRVASWGDGLPEDVKAQVVEIDCSTATCVAWLKSIGYAEATTSKVDGWRRRERERRGWQPKSE